MSLRQEIKEKLPTLLEMMNNKKRGRGRKYTIIDNGTRVRVYDYEDAWLQGIGTWEEIEEFCVEKYTINEFITKYFFSLKRNLFRLRRVEEEMKDDILADLRRAVTHGKVEVWVSVRDVEEKYPTSYYIESYQDIFDVVRKDLDNYIEYDGWYKTMVLEEIIVDGEEIDLGLVAPYKIFQEVYTQKLVDFVKEILEYDPEKDEDWEYRDKHRFIWDEDDGKPLCSAEEKGGAEYVEKLKKFLEDPYPIKCTYTFFCGEDRRHVDAVEEEALEERDRICEENKKQIWERMKKGEEVQIVFGWIYS